MTDGVYVRALMPIVAFVGAFALVGCSEKGNIILRGEKGDKGDKGEKGDPGPPGMTFRVVSPKSASASCEPNEVMISAFCTGDFTAYPLVPSPSLTGARCGNNPNSTTLRVTIVCAKRETTSVGTAPR